MAAQGFKHMVKCVCILPQFSKMPNPPQHEFSAFSEIDASGDFVKTMVQCDNCGVVHKIVDVCTSVISRGRDELSSVVKVEDVKPSVPDKMAVVLEQNNVDLATWQQAAWVVENKQWGAQIVVSTEYVDGVKHGKAMVVLGESMHKIVAFTNEMTAARS